MCWIGRENGLLNLTKRCITVALVAILALLLLLPARYLDKTCALLTAQTEEAVILVCAGGDPAQNFAVMNAVIDEAAPVFRMFLEHGDVDEVVRLIRAASPLKEKETLLGALAELQCALSHLASIEKFDYHALF